MEPFTFFPIVCIFELLFVSFFLVTGENIVSPGHRHGLIPLVIPLSENQSGL